MWVVTLWGMRTTPQSCWCGMLSPTWSSVCIMPTYVDEWNVRVLEQERLSPNSVFLQDAPPSVLGKDGIIDPKKMHLIKSTFGETYQRVDPSTSVTITLILPPKDERLGINFESDETYGFPVLTKVDAKSTPRTQIPMCLQQNCWIVAINSKDRGYIEPIDAKYCLNEMKSCQKDHVEVVIELTFHRKINPINTEYETYDMMSDQIGAERPEVAHIVSHPNPPAPPGRTIFECLDGPEREH